MSVAKMTGMKVTWAQILVNDRSQMICAKMIATIKTDASLRLQNYRRQIVMASNWTCTWMAGANMILVTITQRKTDCLTVTQNDQKEVKAQFKKFHSIYLLMCFAYPQLFILLVWTHFLPLKQRTCTCTGMKLHSF